jgi:sulfur carrier protein
MLYINQQQSLLQAATLADLAQQLALPAQGVALVLDQQLLPRALWAQTPLSKGLDHHIEIFQLVAGG